MQMLLLCLQDHAVPYARVLNTDMYSCTTRLRYRVLVCCADACSVGAWLAGCGLTGSRHGFKFSQFLLLCQPVLMCTCAAFGLIR